MDVVWGSSPHARGARLGDAPILITPGIIPACAGSTFGALAHVRSLRDHPRLRGEHYPPPSSVCGVPGSSPHARGAHHLPRAVEEKLGIIPACAGSTAYGKPAFPEEGDHPRMRGEHLSWRIHANTSLGSSPHARGARRCMDSRQQACGIIPACAGSTRG